METVHEKKSRKVLLYLHRIGYNYFNINKLTLAEINNIIKASNEEQQAAKAKKAAQKMR